MGELCIIAQLSVYKFIIRGGQIIFIDNKKCVSYITYEVYSLNVLLCTMYICRIAALQRNFSHENLYILSCTYTKFLITLLYDNRIHHYHIRTFKIYQIRYYTMKPKKVQSILQTIIVRLFASHRPEHNVSAK